MKLKLFKNWNIFEIVFLFACLLGLTLCFIFGVDKNVLSFIASLVGVVSVLMVAKGLVIAPFVSIVYNVLYSIIAITQKYYGEAIIYIALMMPISIFSIISWLRNKNSNNRAVVKQNNIHKKEYLYLSLVTIVSAIAFYFLLKALNTNELIVSTLSLITSAVASYLTLRRSKYYALDFIANDIILIIMWAIVVKKSGIGYLPTLLSFVIFLLNDIYGFIHWSLEQKKEILSKN